ncbi:MAG: hypothetical protein RLZZ381_100 [Cyanobacteriota bacterium]|jgi:gamma-glutamyltranspeptidase/glutathione hydrolase
MKIRRAISLALSIILLIVMGDYLINNLYLVYSTVDSWSRVNATTVQPKAVGSNGVVVSTQQEASSVGLQVLKDGGNAIDAAVAVGYALAVTDPCCGNLGGGGFMLIHLADGTESFINFRETAPLKADSQMYLDEQGKLRENSSTDGYLAVGVPGTVKGLNYALDQYGTMELKKVIKPAIALAESGFVLHSGDVEIFEAGKENLLQPNVAKIFLPEGKTYQVGDVLIQSDLANTLKAISQEGEEAFYQGEIAQKVVAASQKNNGILSLKDFANYQVQEYEPISCNYRGYRVASSPPPGGGTTVCQMLNILSGYNLQELGWHTPQSLHQMFSSMLLAFGDRNRYLGDPNFVDNPTNKLLSVEYAAALRAKIAFAALDPESIYSTDVQHEGTNTTHYSVVDKEGNAVAVTYTINSYFGAGVIAPETGFLLNNEMDDFTTKLGSANQFGLHQGTANLIKPGKRPLSSMSPTIVTKDGQVYLVTGSPGGSTIPTTVLQVITNVIDHEMSLPDAVNAPRVHYQGLPDQIVAESHAITPKTFRGLKLRNYNNIMPFMSWGAAESILVNGDRTMIGVNDRRKPAGEAVAY